MKTSFPKGQIEAVLLEGVHPHGVEMLTSEGFKVEALPKALEGAAFRKAVANAHIIGIRSKTDLNAQILVASPRLLAVGCFCIGTNQVDLDAACASGVPVFNSPFSNTRSVAELTIAEIVGLHRRLCDKSAQMHAGNWDKSADGAHEVRGRTLGIIGYGRIGSQVSVLAESMGLRVVYFDVLPRLPMGNAKTAKSLKEVLEQSDVVSLHVPATPRTDKLIAKRELAQMKKGSYLINNSRGSVVDIKALAEALQSKHLAGAALDVFPEEPAGKGENFNSEIRNLPNVILTPHVGGSTEEAQESIADDVCGKLLKFVNNGSTTGAVNVPEVELPEQTIDGSEQIVEAQDVKSGSAKFARKHSLRRHRILHFHKNVPGVLSKMHTIIAKLGGNISAEYLQTNQDIGYVVLDVDPSDGEAIAQGLREIPETIRVRVLW